MSYYKGMNFKTLLRKWHTVIGIVIAIPSLFLTVTGLGLLQPNATKTALIASTACPDGAWVGVSSTGIVGMVNIKQPLPFPLTAVAAISCTAATIDIALDYGSIASTPRERTRWSTISRPFDGKIRSIHRTKTGLMVSTQTEVWWHDNNSWNVRESYTPTLAQTIYEWHAGWFNGRSVQWLWWVTGIAWSLLTISGIWIFLRMARR